MPNFPNETGMSDEAWERVRASMAEINRQRHVIATAERAIEHETRKISFVLWPRTDSSNQSAADGGK